MRILRSTYSAYFHSTSTLNYIRSLLASGFADIHHPQDWSLSHVRSAALKWEFRNNRECFLDNGQRRISEHNIESIRCACFQQDHWSVRESVLRNGWWQRGVWRSWLLHKVRPRFPVRPKKRYWYDVASHEGLLLDYEEALTRELPVPRGRDDHFDPLINSQENAYYNTSAHFLWVGDRTRQLDGAHVE